MTAPNALHPWLREILDLDKLQQLASLEETHWRVMGSIYLQGAKSQTAGALECQRQYEKIAGPSGYLNECSMRHQKLQERSYELRQNYASADPLFEEKLHTARDACRRDLNLSVQAQKDIYKDQRGIARGHVAQLTDSPVPETSGSLVPEASGDLGLPVATDVAPVEEAIVAGRGTHFTGVAEAEDECIDYFANSNQGIIEVEGHVVEDAEFRYAEIREENHLADERYIRRQALINRANDANEELFNENELIAKREAELFRNKIICRGMVVLVLGAIAGIVILILSETGSYEPDDGSKFSDSADRLRNDVSDASTCARWSEWDGLAADHYEDHAVRQQARLHKIVAADLRLRDIVSAQANVVVQARGILEAIVVGLAVSIGVAAVWEEKCRVLAPIAPAAALALEAALVVFGMSVALSAICGVMGTLIAMNDAGKKTKNDLGSVVDIYTSIIDDVTATMPSGRTPIGWWRDVAASSAAKFCPSNGWRYDTLVRSSNNLRKTGAINNRQDGRVAANTLMNMAFRDGPACSGAEAVPVSAAPALDMLAGLCRQTVESFGPDRQERFVDQPLMFRPQGLAALAQRVTLDAAGVIRHVDTDVSRMEPCALAAGPKGASSNALAHAARHPACCRS